MSKKPQRLSTRRLTPEEVDERGLRVEELHLQFDNGQQRHFRRLLAPGRPVVMIVPLVDADTVLLIREYAAGLHEYQLQLPKGAVDKGESILEAANRELKEEVGKGAKTLTQINSFTVLPGFMPQVTDVILATDLYDEKLPGDEPEPLEVVPWSLRNLYELAQRPDCTEARSLAALYFVRDMLEMEK